ncbi:MAG: hypothetical protein P8126_09810 [Gammaproteobacteria bacterium]|jgi:hypothetical protein
MPRVLTSLYRPAAILAMSFLFGTGIGWWIPDIKGNITGSVLGDFFLYCTLLFLSGFLPTFIDAELPWIAPIGVYAGEFLMWHLKLIGQPLWLIDVLAGFAMCIIVYFGSGCARLAVSRIGGNNIPS